jgi:hypothetical protein
MAKNKYVDFVPDAHFEKCVKHVVDRYNEEIILDDNELQKNGIDTIKMTFDMLCEGNNFKKWKIKESVRQKDKTVNNAIGEFHQMLLGGVKGWTDLEQGDPTKLDLKKNDDSIFMELKNKNNTVNSDSNAKVREKLLVQIKKHDAIGYFAYFSATNGKSEELDWNSGNLENHKNLKRLSGTKVYEIVTGKPDALEQVWKALPLVLKNLYNIENPLSTDEKLEFKKWFKLAYNK